MTPLASIIILTYNNLDYTRQCLESIYNQTDEPEFEIILVDNASQDGTPEYLSSFAKQHPNVQLILNHENNGFAHGNNQGAAISSGDYLVFLNNDVIVTQGWLTGLIRHLQDPTIGMVGPVTNFSGNESRIQVDYQDISQMQEFAKRYTQANRGRIFEIKMLAFYCVALRRQVFFDVGGLDQRYKIGMFEDDDFARSLHEKGYKTICAEDVFIHHWGNASFSKLAFEDYWNTYHENRLLYEEKWGVKWQPQRYRDELLDQLISQLVDGQAALAKQIIEQDHQVEKQNQSILQKDLRIKELEHKLEDLRREIISVSKFISLRTDETHSTNPDASQKDLDTNTIIKYLIELIGEKDLTIQSQKSLLHQRKQLIASNERKDQEIAELNGRLDDVYNSTSWKLVALIRQATESLKIPFRKVRGNKNTLYSLSRRANRVFKKVSRRPSPGIAERLVIDQKSKNAITSTEYANQRVIIATYTFFDMDGDVIFLGGAERYVVELSRLIRELGYTPEIWQCGNTYWERKYADLKVIGLDTGGNFNTFDYLLKSNQPAARMIIYSPFSIAETADEIPAIGISHGVYWDFETNRDSIRRQNKLIRNLTQSFEVLDRIVSVDTNTINWARATSQRLSNKFNYVPNFVDLNTFKPAERRPNGKIVILYPRRLYAPRGFYLVAEVIPSLLEAYSNIEFHLVGQVVHPEIEVVEQLTRRFPGRVKHYQLPMDRMNEAYQQADIAIIPTVHSEGTSLSCLEALASGNAVIATNVGGLPDLVLSGFNGILIEPNSNALETALVQLIENEDLRLGLAQNGRKVVEAFTLDHWREQWLTILQDFLPKCVPDSVVFNFADGFLWGSIMQRPHHLAFEFARHGLETYWLNKDGQQPDPAPHLHILDWQEQLNLSRPVFFIFYPFSYEEIKQYDHPIVVYDVLDDISIHDTSGENLSGQQARMYHSKLLTEADIIIVSSRQLYDQIKPVRPDLIYVPNGIDLDHFNPKTVKCAPEMKQFEQPVIGYHGAIASWFDGQLVSALAELRPQYEFVLVGPISDDRVKSNLSSQSNIHLLGTVPYEYLPQYVAAFDVCILPFSVTPLTNAVRPLKVLEYLAMRKPVISTPLKELLDWPGVRLASNPEQFANEIDQTLTNGFILENSNEIDKLLRESTWQKAAQPLIEKILTTSLLD